MGIAWIHMQNVCPADRWALIRYLRSVDVENEGWGPFCRKRAVPLIETLSQAGEANDPAHQDEPLVAAVKRLSGFAREYPFLAGAVSPLVIVSILPKFASRSMWWTTAMIIAVSGVINIRGVWGRWEQPFTQIVFGGAAVLFCLGAIAPARRSVKKEDEIPPFAVILSFLVTLIGGPLLCNAMVLEWVRIPVPVVRCLPHVMLLLLMAPGLVHMARKHRREKRQAPALEAEALRRWEAYVRTGILPETMALSADHPSAEFIR
jgi:hypothetical protein